MTFLFVSTMQILRKIRCNSAWNLLPSQNRKATSFSTKILWNFSKITCILKYLDFSANWAFRWVCRILVKWTVWCACSSILLGQDARTVEIFQNSSSSVQGNSKKGLLLEFLKHQKIEGLWQKTTWLITCYKVWNFLSVIEIPVEFNVKFDKLLYNCAFGIT